MPRFVLLDHDHPQPHFDLMLEVGAHLWTWRLSQVPVPGQETVAERIADHRPFYLDHEGPVSGNRGRVLRRAHGTFTWLVQQEETVQVRLVSEALSGVMTIRQREQSWWVVALSAEEEPCRP